MESPEDTAALTERVPDTEAPVATSSVERMLHLAIERGIDVDALERLQAMYERERDAQAARAFAEALADFQAACPSIEKKRTGKVETRGGGSYGYRYANLEDVVRTIAPFLARAGLSYSFDTEATAEGGVIEVCTVRHVGGHSVQSRSPVVTTESKAGMSPQQKVGNAQTYARRYALTGALGITTGDEDNDAAATTDQADAQPITNDQLENLMSEIEAQDVEVDKLLEFLDAPSLTSLTGGQYEQALRALARRRRQRGAQS